MNLNSNEYDKNGIYPSDSFLAAIGKAAEEEMLKECELWELESGKIKIPEGVESQILALARSPEKKQCEGHFGGNQRRRCRRHKKSPVGLEGSVLSRLSAGEL